MEYWERLEKAVVMVKSSLSRQKREGKSWKDIKVSKSISAAAKHYEVRYSDISKKLREKPQKPKKLEKPKPKPKKRTDNQLGLFDHIKRIAKFID